MEMIADNPMTIDRIPPQGSEIAGMPRDERRSASRMKEWLLAQYDDGLSRRRRHAASWIMVRSFLRGIHYFTMTDDGAYRPIPPDPQRPRASVPIIKPMFRHVLGMLNANEFGVAAEPLPGHSSDGLYRAHRAVSLLNGWAEQVRVESVRDHTHQIVLMEGTVGLLRYPDQFRKTMMVRPIMGSEVFPIPCNARTPQEASGFIIATVETKAWLEQQDMILQAMTGRPPRRRMADDAGDIERGMYINLPALSGGSGQGRFGGAVTLTCYLKNSPDNPGGSYFFLVNRTLHRAIIGGDPTVLPGGQVPLEISYFDKDPDDFWGSGLCESQLPAQFSADRMQSIYERNARQNHPLVFYDSSMLEAGAWTDDEQARIPMKNVAYTAGTNKPVFAVPSMRSGGDVDVMMNLVHRNADNAAGFRSGIVFGQQEGRTESGPATSTLNQNAFSGLRPVLSRLYEMWRYTLPGVLSGLRGLWDEQTVLKYVGRRNLGRERSFVTGQIDWAEGIKIRPSPMLAGGTQALLNILFELRRQNQEGGEPLVTRKEMLQGLQKLGALPPGLELEDKAEARITTRIDRLIGDGVQPFIQPADPTDPDNPESARQILEDHRRFGDELKKLILGDGWETFGPAVRGALLSEMRFHNQQTYGGTGHPNDFDDDIQRQESLQSEQFMSAAEADLGTPEGDLTLPTLGV